MLTKLNDIKIKNIFAENRFKIFHARLFNTSKQNNENAELRVIIDCFSFFEIFSKSESFNKFIVASFNHKVFKINENSILFN